jgi:hypothetical protein
LPPEGDRAARSSNAVIWAFETGELVKARIEDRFLTVSENSIWALEGE